MERCWVAKGVVPLAGSRYSMGASLEAMEKLAESFSM